MIRPLPIRWRLTLAFGLALAAVLAVTGTFVYLRMAATLDAALDYDLQIRAQEITDRVAHGRIDLVPTTASEPEPDENVAQILRPDGTVLAATAYEEVRLLDEQQLTSASHTVVLVDRPGNADLDEDLRIRVSPANLPASRGPRRAVLVLVTASLDERNEALGALSLGLALGLGAALAAACLAGYVVAGMALRPVERLRRRAAAIDGPDLDAVPAPLPAPPVNDEIGRLAATLDAMLRRIARTQARQQALIESERRFVADASHQLRTPLTIIRSEIDVALLPTTEADQLRGALASIGEETDRLSRLTGQLLVLAAGDEGHLVHEAPLVDASDLLATVASAHETRAARAGRRILVSGAPGLSFPGDRVRIREALDNLVDNALTHGRGTVEISGWRDARTVGLAVRDEGPGFPAGLHDKVFERFRRGSTTTPGSGLGLAVVRVIAEAHGGRAEVLDPVRAQVALWLPTSSPTDPPREAGSRLPGPSPLAPGGRDWR